MCKYVFGGVFGWLLLMCWVCVLKRYIGEWIMIENDGSVDCMLGMILDVVCDMVLW